MSRIADALSRAHEDGRCGLVCFIQAGDPSLEATADVACAVADAGADVIELGIPFSDPVADGPTIQAAAQRALEAGTTVEGVLDCARLIRRRSDVAMVAMTYVNPILQYGLRRFAHDARDAGFSGVIMTDLPPEEAADWICVAHEAGLGTVFLVTPTSTPDRMRQAAEASTGFLYCVSRLGVTGAHHDLSAEAMALIARARSVARCPICIGFGISRPEHVHALGGVSDGVIVGSALVACAHAAPEGPTRISRVSGLVRLLHAATYRGGSR